MELKFIVLKNKIYQTKRSAHPVCNNSGYEAVFSFDKYWNGVMKTARFICYGKNKEPVEAFDVPIVDGKCTIPPIKISGKVTLGVYGGDIMSTNVVELTFAEGPLSETAPQAAPSVSIYNRIMELFEKYYLRSAKVKSNGELVLERGDGTTINAGSVDGITIVGEKEQSDWAETDESSPAFVKNKPIVENEVKKDSENAVSSFAVYDELGKKLDTPKQEGIEGQALFYSAKGPHWKDAAFSIDTKLDESSTKAVQNKVITAELKKISEIKSFVTPEMYGAKGDGVSDDSQAFIDALKSGKKVVCDGSKAYFFAKPIDVRTLEKGHLDGGGARFENFHIYVNINDSFTDWKTSFVANKFVIENMIFACNNAWLNLPVGWETPLITTGMPMILRNLVIKGYPYVLATTDSYIDFMHCESWSFLTNPELFEGKTLTMDAICALNTSGQYCKPTASATPKIAGDGWRFVGCNEFRFDNHEDYCLIRPLCKQPILFESCIQSRVDIIDGSKVIFNGGHYEQTYITASVLDGDTNAVFINCYFYPTHKLLNHKNVTYINCAFEDYHYNMLGLTLANVTNGRSWYDLDCTLINCIVGKNRVVDTNSLKLFKNSPKRTYRSIQNNGVFRDSMHVYDGWLGGFFEETGTYNYNVYLLATSQPNICANRKAYVANIDTVSKKAEFTIDKIVGGYGIVIVRTAPNGTIQKTEYYLDPDFDRDINVKTNVQIDDNGAFCQFIVKDGSTEHSLIFTPWVTVSTAPIFELNDKLFEANGSLVTLDDSEYGIDNGQIQVVKKSELDTMISKDEVYTDGLVKTANLNDSTYEIGSFEANGEPAAAGHWSEDSVYRTKDFIAVEGGKTIYTVVGKVPASRGGQGTWMNHTIRIFQYDENKNYISGPTDVIPKYSDGKATTKSGTTTLTLNANTRYIKYRQDHWSSTKDLESMLIEHAIVYDDSDVTSYIAPYVGGKIPFIYGENVVFRSPDGALFQLTVGDDGTLGVKTLVYSP